MDDLYKYLKEELRLPNARHYDDFELRGNQLLYDGIEITKKNSEFRSVSAIKQKLGTVRLETIGFTEYTTLNKGSNAMAQKFLNDLENAQNADDIEMMPLFANVLNDTESLMSETSFNGEAFTERERRELNLELQTLRGKLKLLKIKMIFYDGEIAKAEAKVKRLEAKRVQSEISVEQKLSWENNMKDAKKELD